MSACWAYPNPRRWGRALCCWVSSAVSKNDGEIRLRPAIRPCGLEYDDLPWCWWATRFAVNRAAVAESADSRNRIAVSLCCTETTPAQVRCDQQPDKSTPSHREPRDNSLTGPNGHTHDNLKDWKQDTRSIFKGFARPQLGETAGLGPAVRKRRFLPRPRNWILVVPMDLRILWSHTTWTYQQALGLSGSGACIRP